MMPVSPENMRVRYQEEERRRRPVNPDERERPMHGHERQPDPIGMRMARMPVEELIEAIDQRIDHGRGKLREALISLWRRIPASPPPPRPVSDDPHS